MRTISLIVVHCSDTENGKNFTEKDIDRWHRERGWTNGCGYHYVVLLDGTVKRGRPDDMIGAHVKDHNSHSIGVCYIGGKLNGAHTDTRTEAQKQSMRVLLKELKQRFPTAIIVGHNNLNRNKACPCFNAYQEYKDI